MEYKCSECDYTSEFRMNLERHINKKKKCGEDPQIIEVEGSVVCEYCEKTYKNKENLLKHLKGCKVKINEEELVRVKKELEELKNKNTASMLNINGNHNNVNITNNYTIHLTPYNEPRIPDNINDIMDDAWIRKKDVRYYIENVHFSDQYPENRNMCITNLKTKLAKVFNGKSWETKNQDTVINEVIATANMKLEKWLKKNKDYKRYERDFLDYVESRSQTVIDNETKDELRYLLYDNYKNGLVNIKSNTLEIENQDLDPDTLNLDQDINTLNLGH
jgi:hypothetical protein